MKRKIFAFVLAVVAMLGLGIGAAAPASALQDLDTVYCYSPNGDKRVQWDVTWESSNANPDQIRVYKMRAIFADHNPIVGWVVSDVPSATFSVDYNGVVLLTQNFGVAAVDTWYPASGFSSRTGYRIVARVTTGGTSTANTVQCGQSDDYYFPL
jgi:hypothetical protein